MGTSRVPKRRKVKEKEKENHLPDEKEIEDKENRDLLLLLQSPNWLNLPSDLLHSIFDRISSSVPDLFSFSAACTSWRSLAESSLNAVSPPPLLLSSLPDDPSPPKPKRSSMSHLKTLTLDLAPSRTLRSPISKGALNRDCCGYSHGHLIFASTTASTVLIADLFSPSQLRFSKPALSSDYSPFIHGVLTGPPASPSSTLLLIFSPKIYFCKLGPSREDDSWLALSLATHYYIKCLTLFNGTLHVLHTDGTLFALEFAPSAHWKRLPDARFMINVSYTRLVECDGQLLLMCFKRTEKQWWNKIEAFRMDLEGGVWVRVYSIGDWCLFMDYIGRCPLACPDPWKWGGERNCVYFAGPHFGRWSVLPLDGTEFEHRFHFVTFLDRWPSPTWVYPERLARIMEQSVSQLEQEMWLKVTGGPKKNHMLGESQPHGRDIIGDAGSSSQRSLYQLQAGPSESSRVLLDRVTKVIENTINAWKRLMLMVEQSTRVAAPNSGYGNRSYSQGQ